MDCLFYGKGTRKLGEKVSALYGITIEVPKLPFPRISLAKAKEIIRERGYVSPKDDDLNPEDEKFFPNMLRKNLVMTLSLLQTILFLLVRSTTCVTKTILH